MTKWIKPSGVILEVNDTDAAIEAAVKNGWDLYEPAKETTEEPVKPKRGRPFKKKDD